MPAITALSDVIKRAAVECGFDLAGIAPVREFAELGYFPEWIAGGHSGEMRYLESRTSQGELKRAALKHVAPWTRSVVVCALNYNTAHPHSTDSTDLSRGWISRYAWSNADYHDVIMSRLRGLEYRLQKAEPQMQSRCYVDTGPVIERVYAKYAGVGWIGKNTCIINQQLGSWLFLGVILTSLELEPDLPAPDRCGSCTRCLDACPTDAFIGPHKLDASRCISYLTIEKRGDLSMELRAGIGRHVFGCDICQDVCPWNRRAAASSEPAFQPNPSMVNPALDWLATISGEDFRSTFRGSPVKRTKRSGLRRNAVVAMANSGDPQFLPLLEKLAMDEDKTIAEHAEWALKKLQSATEHSKPSAPEPQSC